MFLAFLAFGLLGLALFMAGAAGDRDNFSGDISVTAATGGYTKGKTYLVADSYVVARETKDAASTCIVAAKGCIWATKAAGTGKSFVVGDKVYVKSNVLENATSTGAVLLNATVLEAAGATDTKVRIELHGGLSPAAT